MARRFIKINRRYESWKILLRSARPEYPRLGDDPIRVYLPAAGTPAPVVLFSHGLGGSREGNAFMGRHWAQRGYVAVFLQHPGSDDGVWMDVSACVCSNWNWDAAICWTAPQTGHLRKLKWPAAVDIELIRQRFGRHIQQPKSRPNRV